MVGRSPQRGDCAALLGPGSRGATRCVRCAHFAQTGAASQSTKRALRAASPGPALLAGPQVAPGGYAPARPSPLVVFVLRAADGDAKALAGGLRRAYEAPSIAGQSVPQAPTA